MQRDETAQTYKKRIARARAERRRRILEGQNSAAAKGNATILIWLGKVELDQVDKKPRTRAAQRLPRRNGHRQCRPRPSEFTNTLTESRNDPHYFNEVCLGRPPYWSRQIDMCRAVVDYRVTVVYSGNSIGKDYWIGGLVPWWLYTRKDSLCIVTGPSQTLTGQRHLEGDQAGHQRLPPGHFARASAAASRPVPALVEMRPGWQALGYSTTSVERASGQHARDLLVIVEEASGVEDEIWDAIESLKYTKLVAIGNPIRGGRPIRRSDPSGENGSK